MIINLKIICLIIADIGEFFLYLFSGIIIITLILTYIIHIINSLTRKDVTKEIQKKIKESSKKKEENVDFKKKLDDFFQQNTTS